MEFFSILKSTHHILGLKKVPRVRSPIQVAPLLERLGFKIVREASASHGFSSSKLESKTSDHPLNYPKMLKLIRNLDQKMVVATVRPSWRMDALIHQIIYLFAHGNFTLRHVLWEANSAADLLARIGSSSDTTQSFSPSRYPKALKGILCLDEGGIPSMRFRNYY
ncbi:hypothetical protein ACH5RR_007262 [Cinchona calisaya]|uniref:Uncharacterized protein n=1 Tax=Cinchona calisaya TaxID=153742 RepID=A0ABD3ARF2_9GENT